MSLPPALGQSDLEADVTLAADLVVMTPDLVAEVAALHAEHQLYLAANSGPDRYISGDLVGPFGLVGELLRLAYLGAMAESQATVEPNIKLGVLLRHARLSWGRRP